jgi:hypothetical protein
MDQLVQHGYYKLAPKNEAGDIIANKEKLTAETASASSFQYYNDGQEYFPIFQPTLNANPNLEGNSANKNEDNGPAFKEKYSIHPVVELE